MALPLKGQCHQVLKIIFFMKEPTPYTNVTVRSRILRWITYVTQERLFVLGDSAESNFFFFFFSLQHAEAYRVLLHYFCSITVWSAASQTTLWGGPITRFEPGTTSLCRGRDTDLQTTTFLFLFLPSISEKLHRVHVCFSILIEKLISDSTIYALSFSAKTKLLAILC